MCGYSQILILNVGVITIGPTVKFHVYNTIV